jgi:hypothetical protein
MTDYNQTKSMKYLLFIAVFFVITSLSLRAYDADQAQADTIFKKLVAAQLAKDYDAFVADGTTELKAALSKTQFDASSDLMISKLTPGYDLTPLGELDQHGYQVYLYRFRFKNGGDDMLGTLSLKDGQVGGIYFK